MISIRSPVHPSSEVMVTHEMRDAHGVTIHRECFLVLLTRKSASPVLRQCGKAGMTGGSFDELETCAFYAFPKQSK